MECTISVYVLTKPPQLIDASHHAHPQDAFVSPNVHLVIEQRFATATICI
jgi:hypothetical protein